MNKEEAKARISELSKIIENHNYNYYILANPSISDYDFDMLMNELISLEQQFPDLLLPDSPTQRVGIIIVSIRSPCHTDTGIIRYNFIRT